MKYLEAVFRRDPGAPKSTACERCVYGSGEHAEFCPWRVRFVRGGWNWCDFFDPEQWRAHLAERDGMSDITGEASGVK